MVFGEFGIKSSRIRPGFFFATGAVFLFLAVSLWAVWLRSSILAGCRPPVARAEALVLMAGREQERIVEVARLYAAGFAPKVLIANDGVRSGWSQQLQRNVYNVERAENDLISLGVPREALARLPFVKSGTIYDALMTKRYMIAEGVRKIIVVTSDYHSARTLWVFRLVLGNYPADFCVVQAKSGTAGWRESLLEIVKFDYYLMRYGLLTIGDDPR